MHREHLAPGALPPEPTIPNYTNAEHVSVQREQRRNDYDKLFAEANDKTGLVADPEVAHDIANRVDPLMTGAQKLAAEADQQDRVAVARAKVNDRSISEHNDMMATGADHLNEAWRQAANDKRLEALAINDQMVAESQPHARSE